MSNIRAQKSQHQSSLRYPIASYENEYFFTCRDNKLGKTCVDTLHFITMYVAL